MPRTKPSQWTVADYERAADRYVRRLPMEHFMEGLPQSTQREVTLESLALLRARLPDLQVFNELLVQYFFQGRLRQVVPDNMVRRGNRPLISKGSYILEHEKIVPLLVLEYVSPNSIRKDYDESFRKYEQELRVPYCLIYNPEFEDLQLHRLADDRYERVPENAEGRYELPELGLEVAVRDGWVRFWHEGELLLLPAELDRERDRQKERAEQEKQRAEQEKQRAEREKQRAEQEKQRAEQAEAENARLRELLAQQGSGTPKGGRSRKDK